MVLTAPTLFANAIRPVIPDIPGLHYIPDFLDHAAQVRALAEIDAPRAPWRDDLMRRVQHYGWRYNYKARAITRDMRIGPLPEWLSEIALQLVDRTGLFDSAPTQVIVNEYLPGQGIAMHMDRECFGPAVATVSLGDDWVMELHPLGDEGRGKESIVLERGSALVMTGAARWNWLHGIAKRKTDRVGRSLRERQRRVSLTFRTVPNGIPR